MKGTRHNGRSGKDGVYNPLHNDRRFDPEHSEHIDNERVRQNIYWDCYQGYTTMADRGKEDNFSFNQIEMAYYVDHYSDYVINQNKRHEKARHPDRCKGVEDVLKNKKTCPEESIYQLGTIDEHASVETLVLVFDEFKKEFDERFGSNVHIIDWSLHMDEATPHIHERHVFDATNRYGEIEPKQEAALEELGFELPNPEKKRSKTNNRKVVFDSACRTMFLDICKRHGLEIDEEPSYGGRQYLEKQDYIRMKQKEEIAVQQEMLNQQRDKVNANHLELARQSNHVRANEKVIQSQKEKIEQQEKEFKENFISNSDRILSQGELIEEQREELQQLTLRIEDVETLLDEVSSEAYGRLPYHVRILCDEFANIGQIPKFDKLIATIRSREISASIILQSQSQLKTIYKDAAETILGNCDTMLFLGGKESSTLKEISETLGKETIDLYNTSDTRGQSRSYGMNYQKTGKELMSRDELAVMDGSKCILQLRGVRPFFSDKFDITRHKRYKELSDYDKKNEFDVEAYMRHRMEVKLTRTQEFDLYEFSEESLAEELNTENKEAEHVKDSDT